MAAVVQDAVQWAWLCIPKGLSGNKLKLAVMVTFKQDSFSPDGPFGSHHNWTGYVAQQLKGFNVSLNGTSIPVALTAQQRQALDSALWSRFFHLAIRQKDAQRGYVRLKEATRQQLYRAPTTEFVRTTLSIGKALAALQLDSGLDGRDALANGSPATRPTIGQLFRSTSKQSRVLDASQMDYLQAGYASLAGIFLPPKAPLQNRLAAQEALEEMLEKAPKAWGENLVDKVVRASRPAPPAPSAACSGHSASSPVSVAIADSKTAPTLTSKAVYSLAQGLQRMQFGLNKAVAPHAKEFKHDWARLAAMHMLCSHPFVPTAAAAVSLDELHKSAANRLSMLNTETGLLSKVGMLFDLDVDVSTVLIRDGTPISVTPNWRSAPHDDQPLVTVMGRSGFPLPKAIAFPGVGAREKALHYPFSYDGYLRLDAIDENDAPQFMLSDFRFDDAFLQMQQAAQADRNACPEVSPGANDTSLPAVTINEIRSHDLTLHWTLRGEFVAAQEANSVKEFYLDDLVMGVRPWLGRVDQQRKVNWYKLCRREVRYALVNGPRRPEDIARDDAFVPLVGFDQRSENTATVSDAFVYWNGWGIGLPLPGMAPMKDSPFGKTEHAVPHTLPPFRFGDEILLGASLVLRDGSSLHSDQDAMTKFGATADNNLRGLLVGTHGTKQPFRLRRWERLTAPVALLEDDLPAPEWWPAESAHRIVVATAFRKHRDSRPLSKRIVVPARENDMFHTWKHGVFDNISPQSTAFADVKFNEHGDFATMRSGAAPGTEAGFKLAFWYRAQRKKPYHPDPLVDGIRIYAARRTFAGSDNWAHISDGGGQLVLADFRFYPDHRDWPDAREVTIEVHACARGQRPLFEIHRRNAILKVNLPEGENMVLVILPRAKASSVRDRHAFTSEWLNEKGSDALNVRENADLQIAKAIWEDQPFLANATLIDLEHALDRPFSRPSLALPAELPPRLAENKRQDFHARLTFDPGSTGTVEIYGSWIELEGRPARLATAKTEHPEVELAVRYAQVAMRAEHRHLGNEQLDPHQPNLAERALRTAKLLVQHEFRDQRHREVVYWTRGISRAATPTGDPSQTHDLAWPRVERGRDEALSLLDGQGKLGSRHILATRKPPVPVFDCLLPAFSFHTERSAMTTRRARQMALVVNFSGDWFISGNEEKAGVVLVPPRASRVGGFAETWNSHSALASFWGADPLRHDREGLGRMPMYLEAQHLRNNTVDAEVLDQSGKTQAVRIALYTPAYCRENGTWRIEIEIDNPGAVPRPFVRLAFCRYQKHAIAGCHVSDIVIADYAQLADLREAVIVRDPHDRKTLTVNVFGIAATGEAGQVVDVQMSAWLERRCATQRRGEAVWIQETSPLVLTSIVRDGRTCWSQTLASLESFESNEYRVAVVEMERFHKEGGGVVSYFDLVSLDS
jgi:hypothetical protein